MKVIIIALALTVAVHAQNLERFEKPEPVYLEGIVLRVIDGDTFKLRCNDATYTIRINGIDAPEIKQPYGDSAKIMLQMLLPVGSKCGVDVISPDKYGRLIGAVLPDTGKAWEVGIWMIKHGYAWEYYGSAKLRPGPSAELEQDARDAGLGLWASENPIPPWEWRKMKKRSR